MLTITKHSTLFITMPIITLTVIILGSIGCVTLMTLVTSCTSRNRRSQRSMSQSSQTSSESYISQTNSALSSLDVEIDSPNELIYLEQSPRYYANEECPICLEPLGLKPIGITDCCHHFHYECILEWKSHKSNCPICNV